MIKIDRTFIALFGIFITLAALIGWIGDEERFISNANTYKGLMLGALCGIPIAAFISCIVLLIGRLFNFKIKVVQATKDDGIIMIGCLIAGVSLGYLGGNPIAGILALTLLGFIFMFAFPS